MRFTFKAAVFGILLRNPNEVLLLRRFQTGYQDGKYSLPAGHVDGGETLAEAVVREMNEELGIQVAFQDLTFSHIMHRNADDGERIDVYFLINKWTGEPKNMEPHKADDLAWFSIDTLPKNTVHFVIQAIKNITANQHYSEHGWDR